MRKAALMVVSCLATTGLPSGCGERSSGERTAAPPGATKARLLPDAEPPHPCPRLRPLPRRPELPSLPTALQKLTLRRWRPAVYAAPQRAGRPPWPVIVILHGNYDRPEWECEAWLPVRRHGWLLCPRGMRRPGVDRRLDRWTYAGSGIAVRELHAGLDALERRHPKRISEQRAVLIGFSLGAILGPRVMLGSRLRYGRAVFVEGGTGVDHALIRQLARRGLKRVAYLCGQRTGCGPKAREAVRRWRRRGVDAKRWIMPRAGHGYSDDFAPLAREVFRWLLAPRADSKKRPVGK